MKKLLLFLLFGIIPAYAQYSEVTVIPIVSTSAVDSVSIDSAATKFRVPTAVAGFDSAQYVFGPYIQYGTIITAVSSGHDTVTISKAATNTSNVTLQTINYGLYSATAYGSGDWLGYPFLIWTNTTGGIVSLESILIADSTDQLGNTDLALFSAYSNSDGLDNVAIAVPKTESTSLLGYVALTTATDLGTVKFLQSNNVGLAIPRGGSLYGRLVARSTPTFTSISALCVRLRFRIL